MGESRSAGLLLFVVTVISVFLYVWDERNSAIGARDEEEEGKREGEFFVSVETISWCLRGSKRKSETKEEKQKGGERAGEEGKRERMKRRRGRGVSK